MEKLLGTLFLLKDVGNKEFYIEEKKMFPISWRKFTPVIEALTYRERFDGYLVLSDCDTVDCRVDKARAERIMSWNGIWED